ncbi:protein adenylyltransferase SelO family protein [Candidatus Puniceispirillum sp.]|uniref:protein adenylyltransferase SelO family protein n=1 Tax=Candidatus Puniceispirillum sp. TaxID=2026719 RepID=UPI003F697D0B
MTNAAFIFDPQTIHTALDERFYRVVKPATFPNHIIRYRNQDAANSVGLADLSDTAWSDHFGRFVPFEGSFSAPLALCYHGHQFGHYNPELGDGRGFLFAQARATDGRLLDMGTKGSGTTPFSRSADGRLTLKGAVREILATEMLQALGVTTSKTLSVIETGEALTRHDEPSPTRSAVMVRLSHSHIRIGSFQRLSFMDDADGIETLTRHVVRHYYADDPVLDPAADFDQLVPLFLQKVATSIATTAGQWLAAGFVHGVLNTDNFNITGESFDYGPWRFLPHFDPGLVAAYFDETGRYAYGRQADAALWAVCRLADCFVRFVAKDVIEDRLRGFFADMEVSLARQLQWRLGIALDDQTQAAALCQHLFTAAKASKLGFDQIFHDLYGGADRVGTYGTDTWKPLLDIMTASKPIHDMTHPHFARADAVSMTIDEVEAIWAPIAEADDWSALTRKLDDIKSLRAALAGAGSTA